MASPYGTNSDTPLWTPEEWDRLLARQEELEDNSMARGVHRFRKRLEQAAKKEQLSTYGAAKRLLTGGLDALEGAIRDLCDARKHGGVHVAVKWLRMLGEDTVRRTLKERAEKGKKPLSDEAVEALMAECLQEGYAQAAYMTLKVILDGIEQKRTLYLVATSIADLVLDELKYRRFRELAPKLYEYKLSTFNTSSYAFMARSLKGTMKGLRCPACLAASREMTLSEKRANACPHMQEEMADLAISVQHRYLLGLKLVDLCVTATGLISVHTETTRRSGKKQNTARKQLYVEADPETLEWLSRRNSLLEMLTPVTLPMVVPPLQWGPSDDGGYRYALRRKFPLVRGISDSHRQRIATTDMPLVYQAVNAIQNTAWRVNGRVLDILEAIRERGGGLAGVPKQDIMELPPKPANIGGTDREAEFARVAWKRAAHKVREQNKLRVRDVMEYHRKLDVVKAVRQDRAIFFPHTLDFRGRIYPVATAFSPQGEDVCRGVLEFAEGKPVGEEGGFWLLVHGANCLGEWQDRKVSKMPYAERVALMQSLDEALASAARDPLADPWWAKADDPVQFLAFVVEYGRWRDAGFAPEFVSHLPVSIDGTCNGLQHFSAMFRDAIGGSAVNLVPLDTPQDIYERIAERVKDTMQEDAGENELAVQWLSSGLVKRKLTKRPTMTFGYGSKEFGFQAQLCEYVQGLGESTEESKALYEEVKAHFSREGADGEREARIVQACGYMSSHIWKALTGTVVAAYRGMAWMQACARLIGRQGKAVEWIVPFTGFPVKQEYWKPKVTQIETMLAGKVIRPAVYTNTETVEAHKQANAIAPNVIHSLDAAALMLTVVEASGLGMEHFAAIHDSYGCLAGDMPALARITRRSFVRLYTEMDIVTDLVRQWTEQAEADLPAPPPYGDLDLGGIHASEYFFS